MKSDLKGEEQSVIKMSSGGLNQYELGMKSCGKSSGTQTNRNEQWRLNFDLKAVEI